MTSKTELEIKVFKSGLTQTEIAEIANVSISLVSRVIKGQATSKRVLDIINSLLDNKVSSQG